jgi:hypothetical protein
MVALFVHDTLYTHLCSISSVEPVGPRGVIIKTCVVGCYENYTVYAFVDIWNLNIYPKNEPLHNLLFKWITLIHLTPPIVSLRTLQKTLGRLGLFCTLECLDVLRKWRQTTM